MDVVQQASIGLAIVSLVGTVAQGVLSYLDKRNARELDYQLAMLKDENEDLRKLLDECKQQHDESERDRAELWKKLAAAEARAEAAAETAKRADARIAELESKMRAG